tara:strand:+ start:1699 stop:2121 length:423 start_codon:yes stop_codon:yes gene_type:complete
MKTINKEDVITTESGESTVGDYFTACYDAEIAKGSSHVEASSIADDKLANAMKRRTILCSDCNKQIDYETAPKHDCDTLLLTKEGSEDDGVEVIIELKNDNGYLFTYVDTPTLSKFLSFVDMENHGFKFVAELVISKGDS